MRNLFVILLAFSVLAATAAPSSNLECEFSWIVEPLDTSVGN